MKVVSVYLIMYQYLCKSIDYQNSSYTTLESVYVTIHTYYTATLISLSVHWPLKIARYSNREYIETFPRLRICNSSSSSIIVLKKKWINTLSINKYSKTNATSEKDLMFFFFTKNYPFAEYHKLLDTVYIRSFIVRRQETFSSVSILLIIPRALFVLPSHTFGS